MNIQNLMMQARKMQKDIEKMQSELYNSQYEGDSQMVKCIINGHGELIKVSLKIDELSIDDKEILEDMILLSVNDAMKKMQKDKEQKLGKYNGLLNGLM